MKELRVKDLTIYQGFEKIFKIVTGGEFVDDESISWGEIRDIFERIKCDDCARVMRIYEVDENIVEL